MASCNLVSVYAPLNGPGELLGSYLAVVGGTQAGSHPVTFELDGQPLGGQQEARLSSDSDSLKSIALIFGNLTAQLSTASVGQPVSALAVAADALGNLAALPSDATVRHSQLGIL